MAESGSDFASSISVVTEMFWEPGKLQCSACDASIGFRIGKAGPEHRVNLACMGPTSEEMVF